MQALKSPVPPGFLLARNLPEEAAPGVASTHCGYPGRCGKWQVGKWETPRVPLLAPGGQRAGEGAQDVHREQRRLGAQGFRPGLCCRLSFLPYFWLMCLNLF